MQESHTQTFIYSIERIGRFLSASSNTPCQYNSVPRGIPSATTSPVQEKKGEQKKGEDANKTSEVSEETFQQMPQK